MVFTVCLLSDVSVDVPEELDLSTLRGTGLQPGEEELPNDQQSQGKYRMLSEDIAVPELTGQTFWWITFSGSPPHII